MKGLLVKDFTLMKEQKRFFLLIIFMGICLSVTMADTGIVFGYLAIILPMFSISTISYDEYENGNAFLFSLPISRTVYAVEKYVFAIILGVGAVLAASILSMLIGIFSKSGDAWQGLQVAPVFIFMPMLFQSVMLPIQLKFGAEKSRIGLAVAAGGIALLGFALRQLLLLFRLDIFALPDTLLREHLGMILAGACILTLLILLISIKISIGIMKKKEF